MLEVRKYLFKVPEGSGEYVQRHLERAFDGIFRKVPSPEGVGEERYVLTATSTDVMDLVRHSRVRGIRCVLCECPKWYRGSR